MPARFELTDPEWELLQPLLPADPPRGGRWHDHRTIISGILFRERTGIPWRDLPERFGNWKTVYTRKRRWARDGTWQRLTERLRLDADLPRAMTGPSVWTAPSSALTNTPPAPDTPHRQTTQTRNGDQRQHRPRPR